VISHWETEFSGQPLIELFKLRQGGLVFYGGLVRGSLACVFACGQATPALEDRGRIGAQHRLGYVFGRLGCFMFGCCYGKACELPWAVHFPSDHETYRTRSILPSFTNRCSAWFYTRGWCGSTAANGSMGRSSPPI